MLLKTSTDLLDAELLTDRRRVDWVLVGTVIVVVGAVVMALLAWPDQAKTSANLVFDWLTRTFGASIELVGLGVFVFALWLAFGRHGDVKLGEGEPQYSTLNWLYMFITAGLGSATMYWAFMEWGYYYQTPGLNIMPQSREAMDYSIAYAFFHWGPIPWAMYAASGLAMAYYYHVRKGERLSFAGNIEAVLPFVRAGGPMGRAIDLLFLFCSFGGLIVTVTITVETVSSGIATMAGIADSLSLKSGILVVSTLLFGTSSYIGLDKGLQKLAAVAVVASLVFAGFVLLAGPSGFIIDNTTNAMGLEITSFFHMALFTDPSAGGSFARDWTVFYWLYWIAYLPGFAIFIARVSKGRSIRETVLAIMVAGCAGTMFFFGALTSYAVKQKLLGVIDAPAMILSGQQNEAVTKLLLSMPGGPVTAGLYFVIMLLFLSSHLDATSYTIASVSTHDLREGQEPAKALRLFWVVALAAIPMAMLVIHADLGTLKTGLSLTAVPFAVLLVVQCVGLHRSLGARHKTDSVEKTIGHPI